MTDDKLAVDKLPVKKEVPKAKLTATEQEKSDVLQQIGEILAEYGGLESNIPHSHDYWELTNRYRAL